MKNSTKPLLKSLLGETKMVAPHIKRRRLAALKAKEEAEKTPVKKEEKLAAPKPAPKKAAPELPKKTKKTYKKKED